MARHGIPCEHMLGVCYDPLAGARVTHDGLRRSDPTDGGSRRRAFAPVLGVLLSLSGCGESSSPAPTQSTPSKVAFTVQPRTTAAGHTITPTVQVAIQDAVGNTVPSATNSITLAIGTNAATGTLSGTASVAAASGVASFSTLSINNPATGYTLTASASGLSGATSTTFDVTGFSAVSAGGAHSCGLTAAGAAYCWGDNQLGQLGNNSSTESSTPVPVSGGLTFAAVSAGRNFYTCGLTGGGATYCWGANDYGQLGNNSTSGPQTCTFISISVPCATTPVAVSGGLTLAAVSAGFAHTCGLTAGGAAYCWGWNAYGQLGNNSTTSSSTPVVVFGGLTFAAVSAGGTHSCGLTAGGVAYCWGDNLSGQLGNASSGSRSTPAAVSGGLTFAAVSAGASHSCGTTTGGAGYCWGRNVEGQLGNNSTTGSSAPLAVSGGFSFAAVSAGASHTCGVTIGGAAYCWGVNTNGQLGNNSTTTSSVPVAVSGGLTFAAVSATSSHSCGRTTAGAGYCWGRNVDGRLGDGSTTNNSVPVRVSNP